MIKCNFSLRFLAGNKNENAVDPPLPPKPITGKKDIVCEYVMVWDTGQ